MSDEPQTPEHIIGELQRLIVNVRGWVAHGCSETAIAAMDAAMEDGWAAMGWSHYIRNPRGAIDNQLALGRHSARQNMENAKPNTADWSVRDFAERLFGHLVSSAAPDHEKCKVCRIWLQSAGPGCPWRDCPHKGFGVKE